MALKKKNELLIQFDDDDIRMSITALKIEDYSLGFQSCKCQHCSLAGDSPTLFRFCTLKILTVKDSVAKYIKGPRSMTVSFTSRKKAREKVGNMCKVNKRGIKCLVGKSQSKRPLSRRRHR